jgi:hypothetical protein
VTIDAANSPLTEKGGKEKQRMSRITAKTQDTLLVTAAALYPRHSHAELLEKGLEVLLGNPQPIVYFCAQDPDLQIQSAAILADFAQQIENKAKAITRAKFADPEAQREARTAVKELLVVISNIRSSIKAMSEDAKQFQKLVEALALSLPVGKSAAKRLREGIATLAKKTADLRSKGDEVKARRNDNIAHEILQEADAL